MNNTVSNAVSLSAKFAPAVVKAALKAVEIAALHRDLNDDEAAEIIEEVSSCTEQFLTALKKEDGYEQLSDEEVEELRTSIHTEVMEGVWMLIQNVTSEMKIEVYGGIGSGKKHKEDVC